MEGLRLQKLCCADDFSRMIEVCVGSDDALLQSKCGKKELDITDRKCSFQVQASLLTLVSECVCYLLNNQVSSHATKTPIERI